MSFLESQKTQTLIGIGSLVQNQKIISSLGELKGLTEVIAKNTNIANKISAEILFLQAESLEIEKQILRSQQDALDELRKQTGKQDEQIILQQAHLEFDKAESKKKKAIEKRNGVLRELLFVSGQETIKLKKQHLHRIDAFFQLNAILFSLDDAGVNTELVEGFEEKEYLTKIRNDLEESIEGIYSDLKKHERQDVQLIIDILKIDERKIVELSEKKIKEESDLVKQCKSKIKGYKIKISDAKKSLEKLIAEREKIDAEYKSIKG